MAGHDEASAYRSPGWAAAVPAGAWRGLTQEAPLRARQFAFRANIDEAAAELYLLGKRYPAC